MVLRVVYFLTSVHVIAVHASLAVMMRGLVHLVSVGIVSWGHHVSHILKSWGLDIRPGHVLVVTEERTGQLNREPLFVVLGFVLRHAEKNSCCIGC